MKGFRARVMRSGKTYYYFDGTKPETPLGSDYVLAVKKWVSLTEEPTTEVTDFIQLADRYDLEVMPKKGAKTQINEGTDMRYLRKFFGGPPAAPLDSIKPKHIALLLDRYKATPTTANKLKKLFSAMFNQARMWGYTESENPVRGVKGFSLGKRNVDMSEEVYKAIWTAGTPLLRDAMDLAYLTSQRPGDILVFTEDQIADGVFTIKAQSKTGTPLRIRLEGELGPLVERIKARKEGHKIWCPHLAVNAQGKALTKAVLRNHYVKARTAAAEAHPEIAAAIKAAWFYDLRAKAADDKADKVDDQAAADLLGHSNVATTRRHYLRRGKIVSPTR